MKYTFKPIGICASAFEFEIENQIIKKCIIMGGCPGNAQAISKLITGMHIDDVIKKFKGINCKNKGTSCPDKIALALTEIKGMRLN